MIPFYLPLEPRYTRPPSLCSELIVDTLETLDDLKVINEVTESHINVDICYNYYLARTVGRKEVIEDFRWNCYYGYLAIAKWLHRTYQISKDEAKMDNNWAFRSACENGHLNVAKWLKRSFQISNDEAKIWNNCAFQLACYNGHLNVAKWLHRTFQISNDEAKTDNNWAFRYACENSHTLVSNWLKETFDCE